MLVTENAMNLTQIDAHDPPRNVLSTVCQINITIGVYVMSQ